MQRLIITDSLPLVAPLQPVVLLAIGFISHPNIAAKCVAWACRAQQQELHWSPQEAGGEGRQSCCCRRDCPWLAAAIPCPCQTTSLVVVRQSPPHSQPSLTPCPPSLPVHGTHFMPSLPPAFYLPFLPTSNHVTPSVL